ALDSGEPAVNEPLGDSPSGRALELAQWLDRVCVRFEAAWQSGGRPRLEDYLGEAPEVQTTDLLQELILLEVEYRRRRGEEARPEEYVSRFPSLDSRWLAAAMSALEAPAVRAGNDPVRADQDPSRSCRHTQPPTSESVDPLASGPPRGRGTRDTQAAPTDLTSGENREYPEIPGYEVLVLLGHPGMGVRYRPP